MAMGTLFDENSLYQYEKELDEGIYRWLINERPGKIVYEDEYQIVAIPFKDTFRQNIYQ